MMRFCPKCRAFYDDEALEFCLNDGILLVEINRSDKLWEQGGRAIGETKSIIRRQMFRQSLKKILSTAITTVLVIMTVIVTITSSWIYLNPEEKVNPENSIIAAASPTVEKSLPQTPTPKAKKKAAVPNCQESAEKIIKAEKIGELRLELEKDRKTVREKLFEKHNAKIIYTELSLEPKNISVVSNNCQIVQLSVKYRWIVKIAETSPEQPFETANFQCKKENDDWQCARQNQP